MFFRVFSLITLWVMFIVSYVEGRHSLIFSLLTQRQGARLEPSAKCSVLDNVHRSRLGGPAWTHLWGDAAAGICWVRCTLFIWRARAAPRLDHHDQTRYTRSPVVSSHPSLVGSIISGPRGDTPMLFLNGYQLESFQLHSVCP